MKPFCAFANVPVNKKDIQTAYVRSKCSMMQGIPFPNAKHDDEFGVIFLIDSVKNAFLLGLGIATIQASDIKNDISKCVNNSAADSPCA